MKHLKKFENFSINEEVPGSIGAIVGGRSKGGNSEEKASDKPDEFLCEVLYDDLYKKWATLNCKVTDCKFQKADEKQGFFKKLFSGGSYLSFELETDRLKRPIELTFKLKNGLFERSGKNNDKSLTGYVSDEHQEKFIKWVLTQSQWKDKLKETFEDIDKSFTKESF